jgi:ketosteroid isomerase-like protein
MRRCFPFLLPFLSLFLFLSACGDKSDRDAVLAVAVKRQQALTSRDISLYLPLISPHYQDKGRDHAVKARELTDILASFDKIDYRSLDRRVEVQGDSATVTGSYELRVTGNGKEMDLAGKEELRLRKEAGVWKIVGGL